MLARTVKSEPKRSLRRVVAALVPWMAAADPQHSSPGAADGAVLAHGEDEVLAACRVIAAPWSEPGADPQLIAPHRCDQRMTGKRHELPNDPPHDDLGPRGWGVQAARDLQRQF